MCSLIDMSGFMIRLVLALFLAVGLAACDGEKPHSSNSVQSHNGVSYIPIDDTAFLIPEKTWLKGYARHSTDGMVGSITLHATIPDVQPWSKDRHEEMYWPAGPGKKLEIRILSDGEADSIKYFPNVPQSIYREAKFIEEPSDQAVQGLRRFRELHRDLPTGIELDRFRKKFGDKAVEDFRSRAGTPILRNVFYEFIEKDHVKYFIRCDDEKNGLFQGCHLMFPLTHSLMVDVYFTRDYIHDIVSMADKLNFKLHEFETDGLAYRATLPKPSLR